MQLHYLKATARDSEPLSRIALEAKQNWGYSQEWMQLWEEELTLTPAYISENHVWKIHYGAELIGFYALIDAGITEVDHLWLTPENQRKGFGSQIFEHIRKTVWDLGKSQFQLVAEPHAKGFYDKMGGRYKSGFESKIPGRFLEIYEFLVLKDAAIDDAVESDFPELVSIWENSVKATHEFLKPGDFEFFKQIVSSGEIFKSVPILKSVRLQNKVVAFVGVSRDNLEMLFIHDDFRGKGIGKFLIGYALNHLGVRKVEVNKQNTQAVGFYEHFGFGTYKETATDGLGKPYPILYMSL